MRYKSAIRSTLGLALTLGVIELLMRAFGLDPIVFPPPSSIVRFVISNDSNIFYHSSLTLLSSLIGFLIGNFFGVIVGTGMALEKGLREYFLPQVVFIKAIPIVAIAPLLIVWFGSGFTVSVATAAIICFFPIVVNTLIGFSSIPSEYLDLFHSMKATRFQILRELQVPFTLPFAFAAFKTSSTLAVVGAIVGEFVGPKYGLGWLILNMSFQFDIAGVYASILMSGLIGITLFYVINLLEQRVCWWSEDKIA